MKCFLLSFLAACTVAAQSDFVSDSTELLLVAASSPVVVNGQTNRLVQLSKTQWNTVNTGRKLTGGQLFTLDEARTNSAINRIYFENWLRILYRDMSADFYKIHNRAPTPPEFYAGYALGTKKFKRLNFDITKITDTDVKSKIQQVEYEWRIRTLKRQQPAAHPSFPPLPTVPRQTARRTG